MDKIIYHFDPTTGEFLHSGPVYIGPAGDEQIPAFATVTPPPDLADGHVAAVVPGSAGADHSCAWSLVPDWRAATLYQTDDGAVVQIGQAGLAGWSGLGQLPGGVTDIPRPSLSHLWSGNAWAFDLPAAKAAKLSAIDDQCAAALVAAFEAGGHRFNADPVSMASILAAGQIAGIAKSAGREYSTSLVAADGTEVGLDVDGLIDVALALGEHQDACRKTAKQLRDEVANAGDAQTLAAIEWPVDGAA